ncbi:MAG: AraC family transcriptional regulator [Saprospiraceae bacterium]|nr:AraC family transcriptional regulator [Saprospiraceae bacterium]
MQDLTSSLFNGFTIAGILIGGLLMIFIGRSGYPFRGRWILFWLGLVSLHQIYYVLVLNEWVATNSLFALLGFPLAMLHMPVFYLNLRELMGFKRSSALAIFLHVLPYCMYALYLIGYYLTESKGLSLRDGFLAFPAGGQSIMRGFNGIPIAISGAFYVVLCVLALRDYEKALPGYYANLEGVDLSWIKRLATFIGLLFLIIFLLITLGSTFKLFDRQYVFRWVSFTLTIFTVYYGYRYLKQVEWFLQQKAAPPLIPTNKYAKSSLSDAEMQRIEQAILQSVKEEQLYLDEQLTLVKLADQIGESSQKVSETLNRRMATSFYNLVNRFRVEQAKLLLLDPQAAHLSIEGIAYECGFKSRSTFFKFFKKEVGMTPTAFKSTSGPSRS